MKPRAACASSIGALTLHTWPHAFLDPNRVIRADQRHEYGEERLQMLAQVQGRLFHVVFTMRGVAIRIISARKANLREVRDYENGAFQT